MLLSIMEIIPIKTRVLNPPQDDLYSVLDTELAGIISDGDVVLISSKVVALNEGRCVSTTEVDKDSCVANEADIVIPRPYWPSPLTVTSHTFLGAAGVDESNGNGFYVLLPQEPFRSAESIYRHLKDKFGLDKLGVIITDSHSTPFRYGATGVAISWWGIKPIQDHRGRADLFGRKIQYERSNLVDGLAAAATVVAGEVDECIPIVIARSVPALEFVEGETKGDLFVDYSEDTFRVLYEDYLE